MRKGLFIVSIVAYSTLCASGSIWKPLPPRYEQVEPEYPQTVEHLRAPPQYRRLIYQAAMEAGIPAKYLDGIASAESDYTPKAVSKDTFDRGMFQLRKHYDKERALRWGAFDPFDPESSSRIAARLLAEGYEYFNDWPLAITSYRHGIAGAKKKGVDAWYVNRVLTHVWRSRKPMILSATSSPAQR